MKSRSFDCAPRAPLRMTTFEGGENEKARREAGLFVFCAKRVYLDGQSPITGSSVGVAAGLGAGAMELIETNPSTGFSPRTCSR
jgi:hypothetical protein